MKTKLETIDQYDWASGDYIGKVRVKYAGRIGMFLIRFSALEHTLNLAIAEYLGRGSHDLGYLVLERQNLLSKIDLFRRLFKHSTKLLKPTQLKRLEALVGRLGAAREFRNHVAHANWDTLEPSGYVRTRVAEKDGEVVFRKVRITPDVLRAWTRRVEKLDEQLYDFAEEAGQF